MRASSGEITASKMVVSGSAGLYDALRWLVCQLWSLASARELVLYDLHLAGEGW